MSLAAAPGKERRAAGPAGIDRIVAAHDERRQAVRLHGRDIALTRRPAPVPSMQAIRPWPTPQPGRAICRRRPGKAALLQDLVVEAKSLTIPKQQLDAITTAAPECEDRTGHGLLAKRRLHQRHQAIDPLAYARSAVSKVTLPRQFSGADPQIILEQSRASGCAALRLAVGFFCRLT